MYNTIRVPNSLKRGVGPWQFFAVFFFFLSFLLVFPFLQLCRMQAVILDYSVHGEVFVV